MARYASAKIAVAECDVCGFRYKLKELKNLIVKGRDTNVKACPECWNPDQPQIIDFEKQWELVPDNDQFENGFKVQWEEFLRHVEENALWKYDILEGAKGVQLVECALRSWKERRWTDIPKIEF